MCKDKQRQYTGADFYHNRIFNHNPCFEYDCVMDFRAAVAFGTLPGFLALCACVCV